MPETPVKRLHYEVFSLKRLTRELRSESEAAGVNVPLSCALCSASPVLFQVPRGTQTTLSAY